MCGLAGFFRPGGIAADAARRIVESQAATLDHRGPDDAGCWIDPQVGVALGHRRLSILDLSAAGHQPMESSTERYVIALNGEIYNHREMREALERVEPGVRWRGHRDTETLLAVIERDGPDAALERAVGMFAFALWDRRHRVLSLARDRLGEKPLYYGWQRDAFLFGSELKALKAHPAFRGEIDRRVVDQYVRDGYVRGPDSIFRGIHKLPPGTVLQVNAADSPGGSPRIHSYWSLGEAIDRARREPFRGDEREAAVTLERLLRRSVASQSVADVSVGAFLSGGIDSSLVTALMAAQTSMTVRTFTIGFRTQGVEEAPSAKAVADRLGTQHTECYVSESDAQRVIPLLPRIYDEPFGDSSAIPTYLVAQLARSSVTVALSGDGGDELFGGYDRYRRTAGLWARLCRAPQGVRRAVGRVMRAAAAVPVANGSAERLGRGAAYLDARTAQECYVVQVSHHAGAPSGVLGVEPAPFGHVPRTAGVGVDENLFDLMMREDTLSYLPDDILVKVDRAAMAVGLETRVPLLDHRVVEFVWTLPQPMRSGVGVHKNLQKMILAKFLPANLLDRPKAGFGIPVGPWLRGPLREWAEDLLAPTRLRAQGLFDESLVRRRWIRFLQGGRISVDGIWPYLMFQSWLDG